MDIETAHAHIDTATADCDGPFYREYIVRVSDDEREASVKADGVNDFWEIDFMNRVLVSVASPYACSYGMTVKIDDDGIEVDESTDEGYRRASVRWCDDDGCDPEAYSQRDVYAEMAGY